MHEYKMICPAYMKDFKCINSECEDSCCIGWTVTVDKATYINCKNYNGSEKLKKMFDSCIEYDPSATTDNKYAKITMDEQMICPFLNEAKLCHIQCESGLEVLSSTCLSYPRHYIKINEITEMSSALSCPEIARLALLNKEGISFTSEPLLHEKIDYILDNKNQEATKYFFDIQATAITILQNRDLSLEKRIMLLGVYAKELSDTNEDNTNVIQAFNSIDVLNAYSQQFNNFKPRHITQITFFNEMILNAISSARNPKYISLLTKAATAFFCMGTDYEILNNYIDKGIPRYHEFLNEYSYIIENYLVNSLFEQAFPFNTSYPEDYDVFLSYMTFAVKYTVLKTLIIGLLISGDALEDIVSLVQTYAKGMHHNKATLDDAITKIKENGNYSLENILELLCD